MLEKELDSKYEGPSRYRSPGDINSEIFPNVSTTKLILYLGIGLAYCGACFIADKTKEIHHRVFNKK